MSNGNLTKIVKDKFPSQKTILLSFGIFLSILSLPKAVIANTGFPEIAKLDKNKSLLEAHNYPTKIPPLPSLGDATQYLPLQEIQVHLVIRLKERRVYVYQGETEIISYPIAVGKEGWETPTGTFQVLQKLRDPYWEHPWNGKVIPPGADNPLGDRWIGFWTDGKNYIGFHGTPSEELVGQAVSHGCIRMKNDDVRALFEKVDVGTPVAVQP